MKRAIRRHHVKRLQHNRKFYYGGNHRGGALTGKALSMAVQYPADCSCTACGNPRKWFHIASVKERLNQLNFVEQCDEEEVHVNVPKPRKINSWR